MNDLSRKEHVELPHDLELEEKELEEKDLSKIEEFLTSKDSFEESVCSLENFIDILKGVGVKAEESPSSVPQMNDSFSSCWSNFYSYCSDMSERLEDATRDLMSIFNGTSVSEPMHSKDLSGEPFDSSSPLKELNEEGLEMLTTKVFILKHFVDGLSNTCDTEKGRVVEKDSSNLVSLWRILPDKLNDLKGEIKYAENALRDNIY